MKNKATSKFCDLRLFHFSRICNSVIFSSDAQRFQKRVDARVRLIAFVVLVDDQPHEFAIDNRIGGFKRIPFGRGSPFYFYFVFQ